MAEEQTDPTQEDFEKGAAVADAGVKAATREPEPAKKRGAAKEAMRGEAERQGLELSDADADKIADALIGKMDARGAFEPPPEPVEPPPAAPGPETISDPAPQPQRGSSFAERFRSK